MSEQLPRLFRLRASGALERQWRKLVWKRLEERRRRRRNYHRMWERAVRRGSRELGVGERVRFQALHRQFEGRVTPGLPSLVRAARFLWKQVRRVKQLQLKVTG